LGVIGCGERGRHDMSQFMTVPTVNVAAVCDIYGEQIDKARSTATNARNFTDHRKLLEMKEVDAVLIATPDHWHSRVAIDALRAGAVVETSYGACFARRWGESLQPSSQSYVCIGILQDHELAAPDPKILPSESRFTDARVRSEAAELPLESSSACHLRMR